ncbi:hypothetical protein QZH41_019016 [Actinostola sp. cb2023]|nr:hypothetical protein QZH41_019016 [Actinostola sp. cb2023]
MVFIDATFGAGGHSYAILNSAKCKVYALDRDPTAIDIAQVLSTWPEYNGRLIPIHGKFSQLLELARNNNIKEESVHGVLLDIGPSSMQLDDPSRGFSVNKDGPLDMRMDGECTDNKRNAAFTAADVVNSIGEQELVSVLRNYGGEKDSEPTFLLVSTEKREALAATDFSLKISDRKFRLRMFHR